MKRINVFKPHKAKASKVFNGRANVDALYKTPEWVSYRSRFLHINTRCYPCGAPSTVVDHLKIHRGDIKLFEQNDNHIPMCAKCHNRVTALFDRHVVQKYKEKLLWLSRSRSMNGLTFKVFVIPYRG